MLRESKMLARIPHKNRADRIYNIYGLVYNTKASNEWTNEKKNPFFFIYLSKHKTCSVASLILSDSQTAKK